MSMVEGVGDEVTNFFIVMTILFVGYLAWCSTSITNQPLIRTVLILRDAPANILSIRTNQQNVSTSTQDVGRSHSSETDRNSSEEEEALAVTSNDSDNVQSNCPNATVADTASELPQDAARSMESTSEEVLIEAMDSFSNSDRSLLQKTTKADSDDSVDGSTLDQTTSTTTITASTTSLSEYTSDEATLSNSSDITIKLKFINDDQKVVTGSLKEMLGDFKRRHFQMELEARKAVRLVFNGRVLQPDTQTLEQCGLFNDCVVHCWVHQPRPAAVPASAMDNSSSIYFNSQPFPDLPTGAGISSVHNDWDLSRLLVSLLTLLLGLAWYSRYHYAQLFTATTTLALYALTAIFSMSLFSNFFPDQDNIRNVE